MTLQLNIGDLYRLNYRKCCQKWMKIQISTMACRLDMIYTSFRTAICTTWTSKADSLHSSALEDLILIWKSIGRRHDVSVIGIEDFRRPRNPSLRIIIRNGFLTPTKNSCDVIHTSLLIQSKNRPSARKKELLIHRGSGDMPTIQGQLGTSIHSLNHSVIPFFLRDVNLRTCKCTCVYVSTWEGDWVSLWVSV